MRWDASNDGVERSTLRTTLQPVGAGASLDVFRAAGFDGQAGVAAAPAWSWPAGPLDGERPGAGSDRPDAPGAGRGSRTVASQESDRESASRRTRAEEAEARREAAREAEWIERARSGDRDAFRELVERHEAAVVRLAWRWLRDPDAAHDVAQEVFIKAYRALDRFEGRSRFSTWLYRLTVNQCHDWRRRENARPPLRGPDAGPDAVDVLTAPPADGDPARAAERSDLRRGIRLALAALPEDLRNTLVLREVEDRSYAEIAEILGIPKGTVMSRLHNGRKRLRTELERLGWTAPHGDADGVPGAPTRATRARTNQEDRS